MTITGYNYEDNPEYKEKGYIRFSGREYPIHILTGLDGNINKYILIDNGNKPSGIVFINDEWEKWVKSNSFYFDYPNN